MYVYVLSVTASNGGDKPRRADQQPHVSTFDPRHGESRHAVAINNDAIDDAPAKIYEDARAPNRPFGTVSQHNSNSEFGHQSPHRSAPATENVHRTDDRQPVDEKFAHWVLGMRG